MSSTYTTNTAGAPAAAPTTTTTSGVGAVGTGTGTGTTHTTGTAATAGSSAGRNAGSTIKSVAAGIHGLGETIRGTINSGVDEAFTPHNNSLSGANGVAKNEAIAQQGVDEMETGRFSENTKRKEGARPGDGI